jgi:Domain of unknown function (DU1801)
MPAMVAAAFETHTAEIKGKLQRLRRVILDTAEKMDDIGALEETLKWGQPAYLSKGGSTIRIDAVKNDPKRVAIYFICHTDLIATFRELYPELAYEGNRAIVLNVRGRIPEDALRHCVSLALTYRKRRRNERSPSGVK